MYPILNKIISYWGYTSFTPTLPALYWDVESQEERIKKICLEMHKLCEYANYLGENINLDHETIELIYEEFEKFKDSGFTDYYIDIIKDWIDKNFAEIIKLGIRQVFFGLTDDGHFVAYIPDSWSDIQFDTGAVYSLDTYGRLILRMDVDGRNVTQIPEVVRP